MPVRRDSLRNIQKMEKVSKQPNNKKLLEENALLKKQVENFRSKWHTGLQRVEGEHKKFQALNEKYKLANYDRENLREDNKAFVERIKDLERQVDLMKKQIR